MAVLFATASVRLAEAPPNQILGKVKLLYQSVFTLPKPTGFKALSGETLHLCHDLHTDIAKWTTDAKTGIYPKLLFPLRPI
ncbi:MAG: hypothetical protein R3C68_19495 [Myxococcota bacterium]